MMAILAFLAFVPGAAADPTIEGDACDAAAPQCGSASSAAAAFDADAEDEAIGVSLRQLRAAQRHRQVEAAQAHLSLEGADLGGQDLLVSPGKVVLVQGTGLLMGPRADVLRLAEAAGADLGAEEPFPVDCAKVDELPQLTLAFGEGEALALQGRQYTARRADGQCVLTATTLEDRGTTGADWVVGDFGQLSLAALVREHWFGLSSDPGSSILSGSKCPLCKHAVKALGTSSVDTMCTSTCHSYGIPFGCSTLCHKLEKHICGSSNTVADEAENCGNALCGYFMPSCSHDGSDSSGSSSSSWASSVFGSSTKCTMCLAAFKAEGGKSVDQACLSTCQQKGIPFGCSTICRKLEQKICGTTGDGSGNPECGKALCSYFITGCGKEDTSV